MGSLCVGLEYGTDRVLARLRKDHDIEEAIRQLDRLSAPHGAHLMTGAGRRCLARENGFATARRINRVRSSTIINVSMLIPHRAPLYREVESGVFPSVSRLEHLQEERAIIENLG